MANQRHGSLRILRPADLRSLELRVGVSFQHPYPRHWHEEFFVSAITAGAGVFHFRGGSHLAAPGALVWVVPGEVHAHYDLDGGRSFRSVHMPWSMLVDLAAASTARGECQPGFASSMITDVHLFQAFLRLHRALEGSATRLHRETLLLIFFAELLSHVGEKAAPNPAAGCERLAVRRAREYLHAQYNQAVSLKEIACLANISPYHFHRVFCRQVGIPPHAYQVQLRILRAKVLLQGGMPVVQAATHVGFADQSHFTRHFKRLLGVTPAQYARQSKNVQDGPAHGR